MYLCVIRLADVESAVADIICYIVLIYCIVIFATIMACIYSIA